MITKKMSNRDLKMVFEFFPVARDELIPGLRKGYGDIAAAGLTIIPERSKKVDFTTPYLTGIDEVVVTHSSARWLKDVRDLSGKKVYVRRSSSYYHSLEKLNTRLRKKKRQPVKIQALRESMETESILEMVNSGALKITVADSHIARAWSSVLPDIRVRKDLILHKGADIAWMVRKNNPKLKQSLNSYLQKHKKGTLLGNIYFNRYYKNAAKLKNPIELEEWNKVKQYKDVIQKYADQYDFDWLLILAMAFQESGLDQNRWFRNVELATLRMIGQETVRYVSNTNKYYVLYQTMTNE